MATKEEVLEFSEAHHRPVLSASSESTSAPTTGVNEEKQGSHDAIEILTTREEVNTGAEVHNGNEQTPLTYLKGWRLHLLTTAFVFADIPGLYLAFIDVS